jgi:hypothetical protein
MLHHGLGPWTSRRLDAAEQEFEPDAVLVGVPTAHSSTVAWGKAVATVLTSGLTQARHVLAAAGGEPLSVSVLCGRKSQQPCRSKKANDVSQSGALLAAACAVTGAVSPCESVRLR